MVNENLRHHVSEIENSDFWKELIRQLEDSKSKSVNHFMDSEDLLFSSHEIARAQGQIKIIEKVKNFPKVYLIQKENAAESVK